MIRAASELGRELVCLPCRKVRYKRQAPALYVVRPKSKPKIPDTGNIVPATS